ncbi:hypothetical protein [Sphingomonas sp. Leaf343]|uniref:hypothetical protein n=1 Tax=Sphingomonas sp. Leaf343 TaxID=1736345 RepID=UPI001444946C|nr:hypothetical protein [Sphingomonas sp. Leaf343]
MGQDLYERNSRLDNIRYTGRLNVTRESGGIVGFRLTGLATRSLTSFSDLRTPIRNIQNIYQADAEVTYPVTPDIRLVATPEFLQNKNSDALVSGNDFRRYGTGIGIGYYNAIGNSIALTLSRRQTDGLKARTLTAGDGSSRRADIDLADTSVDLRLRYSPSPITAVNGVISYLSRNDRSVIGSDYSGPSGYMRFDYRPRDTLTIMGEVGRRLELQSFLVVDAVRADYGNTEVRLGYSDHLFLILTGEIYHRRFRFDPTFTGQVASRNDRNYLGAFAIEYSPRDRVMLRARYAHEFRKSDAAFGGFNSDTVQLSAIVRLGNKD